MSILREVGLREPTQGPDGPDLPRPSLVAPVIGVLVLLAAIVLLVLTSGSDARIKAIAAEFVPGPGWVQHTDRVEPPRHVCLADSPCPSVFRSWQHPQPLTETQFRSLVGRTGWDLTTTCEDNGTYDTCTAEGVVDRYEVEVRHQTETGEPTLLTLSMRRAP